MAEHACHVPIVMALTFDFRKKSLVVMVVNSKRNKTNKYSNMRRTKYSNACAIGAAGRAGRQKRATMMRYEFLPPPYTREAEQLRTKRQAVKNTLR